MMYMYILGLSFLFTVCLPMKVYMYKEVINLCLTKNISHRACPTFNFLEFSGLSSHK